MPKIRRWFPVTHDINSDPEVWEMRNTIGERSLGIWLEMLSIGDRNGGAVGPLSDSSASAVAFKCHSSAARVRRVWDFALTHGWLVCDPDPRIAKYADYHRSRVPNEIPPRKPLGSLPSEPSEPYYKTHKNESYIPLKRKNNKTPYPENFALSDDLRAWVAKQHCADPDGQLEAFHDYHVSHGSRFTDWNAAYRTWIRNSIKFNRPSQTNAGNEASERLKRSLLRGL